MHYHCEIVMPPTDDIEGAVESILKPFNECDDGGGADRSHTFWDFYVIGGRWAGHKLIAKYDQAKIDEFYAWCREEKITVSGLQAGKRTLQPASQIEKVDAKWNEMFPPEGEPLPCPLFSHSNDQYGKGLDGTLPDDVMRFSDVPAGLTCSHVIFAKPSFESETGEHTGPLEAAFMLTEDAWNGCNHMKVDWDRQLASAVEKYRKSLDGYKDEYRAKVEPKDDWLVVTVDYHS